MTFMEQKTAQKTVWTPLWHIYQPPNQSEYWLKKVAEESYQKIIDIYKKFPNSKLILNINGSLTQLLLKHKLDNIINGFKELAENGQLEFVSTLCYHAIAPLIPEKEMIRQIKLNDEINKKAFGSSYNPTGVWLPEMAYSRSVIKPIAELGYSWISLPGVVSNDSWTNNSHTFVEQGKYKLKVLFRDDRVSLDIAFGNLNDNFPELLRRQKGTYLFTTMDGETIGHHIPKLAAALDNWLSQIQNSEDLTTMSSKELFENFPEKGKSLAFPGSWSTTFEDIQSGNFYPLWLEQHQEPFKSAHRLAWDHLYNLLAASNIIDNDIVAQNPEKYSQAREVIDKALFSCAYWWFTREAGHRASPRFLAGLDMQAKAMRKLLELQNSPELHTIAETNEKLREKVYEVLNNWHYGE